YFRKVDMKNEIKQNLKVKLELISDELMTSLDTEFEALLRRNSADGMLRSGKTIKDTMELVSRLDSNLYSSALVHIDSLNIQYSSSLESDISCLVSEAKTRFAKKVLSVFQRSTEIAGKPDLYEALLPDLMSEISATRTNFENQLNLKIIELKRVHIKTPLEIGLWVLELVVIALLIFISGMWFSDPEGNYEPLFAGLGLLVPFIYVLIRRTSKQ
ncbi:hypothetical protein ACFKIV_004603, partial [Vibrio alginolyticus]